MTKKPTKPARKVVDSWALVKGDAEASTVKSRRECMAREHPEEEGSAPASQVVRRQARRGNGRFTRNTLANTFGLQAPVCAECRAFNPRGLGEPAPDVCQACGKPFRELASEGVAGDDTK